MKGCSGEEVPLFFFFFFSERFVRLPVVQRVCKRRPVMGKGPGDHLEVRHLLVRLPLPYRAVANHRNLGPSHYQSNLSTLCANVTNAQGPLKA